MRGLYRNAPSTEAGLVTGVCHAEIRFISRNANQRLEPQDKRSLDARQCNQGGISIWVKGYITTLR